MKVLWLMIVLSVALHAAAQSEEPDTLRWKVSGQAGMDANLQSGNLEQRMFSTTLAPVLTYENLRLSPYLQYRFTRVFENVLQDDIFTYFSLDFPYRQKVYFNLSVMYENAALRFIRNRIVLGPGLAWKAVDKEKVRLTLINSLIYDATEFEVDENRNYDGLRYGLALQGNYQLLGGKLLLNHQFFYQPIFRAFAENQRLRLMVVAALPLSQRLNVQLHADYIYESIVDASRKQSNMVSSFGVSYRL